MKQKYNSVIKDVMEGDRENVREKANGSWETHSRDSERFKGPMRKA